MDMPQRQVPSERKALYYAGMALGGIGLLLFLSTFVSFIANFGNFDNFEGRAKANAFCVFFWHDLDDDRCRYAEHRCQRTGGFGCHS